jgi:MFS family permease
MVGFVVAMAAVTYLDRICISTLAPRIMRDLQLTTMQMSAVFSAFAIAYAAFEIPSARWGERTGTRAVLTRIVAWWSAFTIATAAAWNYWSLIVIRFLFGAGEAGAWPNAAHAFSKWIPLRERGKVQGVFFAGAHLAGGLTPGIVTALLAIVEWRAVFVIFGAAGFVWAIAWYRWFRDDPAEHPQVGEEELRLIVEGRSTARHVGSARSFWLKMIGERNFWALCLSYFSNSYGSYFVMTWLPAYLEERRGFAKAELGLFAGLPLILSVAGDLAGGGVTDWMTRRFGLRIGRGGTACAGYLLAGAAMLGATFAANAVVAAILIAVAVTASMFTLAASWAACLDIGGEHSGVLSASMNTTGQLGSILSPLVAGAIVHWFADWNAPLLVMAALYFASSVLWLAVDPRRAIQWNHD